VTLTLKNPMDTVDQVICDYLMNPASEDDFVDFVGVGNTGADYSSHDNKKYMGSVAHGVISKTKVNVMFFA
jgi:hypothetical protein